MNDTPLSRGEKAALFFLVTCFACALYLNFARPV